MTEHLLDLADVVVCLQQMRCKRMPQCVWSNPLRNFRLMRRRLDSLQIPRLSVFKTEFFNTVDLDLITEYDIQKISYRPEFPAYG